MRRSGRVGVVGAGPAGLAAALAMARLGIEVQLFERYPDIRPAGNLLNLWPPPIEILRLLGVDVQEFAAPSTTTLRRFDGHLRCEFRMPAEVVAKGQGGIFGMRRWDLYKTMIDALPPGTLHAGAAVTGFEDHSDAVRVELDDGTSTEVDVLVGADGLHSTVRRRLWGDQPIRDQRIHLVAGYTTTGEASDIGVLAHDRTRQGSYTPVIIDGAPGYGWWMLEAFDPRRPFDEPLRDYALARVGNFAEPLPSLVRATAPETCGHWEIRDRPPMSQWSRGRVTLIGDSCHPTSPYASHGAGMSIEDGYFLAAQLTQVDLGSTGEVTRALQAFEDVRRPYTRYVTEQARQLGRLFHHAPAPLRPIRDAILDHTPFMQKVNGDATPRHIMAQLAIVEATERDLATGPADRRPLRVGT